MFVMTVLFGEKEKNILILGLQVSCSPNLNSLFQTLVWALVQFNNFALLNVGHVFVY